MRHLSLIAVLLASAALGAQQPKPQGTTRLTDSAAVATTEPWVATKKGLTYYRAGCKRAEKLATKNLIYFKTEDDARRAGYTRSRSGGC